MPRTPYGNGQRTPDFSRHSPDWREEYGDDLADEGRFPRHPMQRAGRGFAPSAPQPRAGSQYESRRGFGREEDSRPGAFGYGRESEDFRSSELQDTPYGTGLQRRPRNRGPRNWQRSDERIREDICERLSALDDVDVSDVGVAVEQGRATLTGTVRERFHKHWIEDVADDCIGVREVENRIRVKRDDERSTGGFWSQLFGFDTGSRACDVMTRDVLTVSPGDIVQRAAQIMKDAGIGSVPVCDGQRLQGMITDRDIAVRVVSANLPADRTQVSQAMTAEVFWCYEDDDVADVLDKMGDRQVRRIPVVDRDHRLAGIISLGDMALQRSGSQVGDALEEISTPSSRGSTASGATGSPDASGPSPTSPDSPHPH